MTPETTPADRDPFIVAVKSALAYLRDGVRLSPTPLKFLYSARERHRPHQFEFSGRPFLARRVDWFSVREIIFSDEYGIVRPLLARCSGPPVVADLGANIGLFSLLVFSCRPDAQIDSYEPASDTFELLRATRSLQEDEPAQWCVHNEAVSDSLGKAHLARGVASTGSRLEATGDRVVRTVPLGVVLDRLGGYADLLKIDIEGAEQAFLCSRPELLESVSAVMVEIHPDRVDTMAVMRVLQARYRSVNPVDGRASAKPLILAHDGTA